jgi:hypothetical protein
MKDFIHTGYYAPSFTTVDDPLLKVIEIDNGHTWSIGFYVGNNKIDHINMEYLHGSPLHPLVKTLPVYNDEGKFLGSVAKRITYALQYMAL